MKTFLPFRSKLLLFGLLFCFSFQGFTQQTLTKINGWNAYVHLPDDYNTTGTQKYPLIIFFPGTGEVGTDPNRLIIYGPNHFIASGWNGNITLNGTVHKPIIISLQPPAVYPQLATVDAQIEAVKSLYRVDPLRISLTGLSMGGWVGELYVQTHPDKVSSVVALQAVKPDDNPAYPAPFATYAQKGGHWLGYEQINDARDMLTIYNTMANAVPGSATYFQTNVGGGGHCCWNTWYDPAHTDPYSLKGTSGNWTIYQYMMAWSVSSTGNIAPTVSAGSAKTITLPTNSVTLTGTATGNNGATLTSASWTKVSGGAATIASPSALSTSITGLVAGSYSFKLTVTDNHGLSSSSTVAATVNAAVANVAPTVSAGSAKTITLPTNSVTLTGTATGNNGATLTSASWTKVSGGAATIASPSALSTSITGLVAGSYSFKLTVTDNHGLSGSSTVAVTVNAAAANTAPTVSAGSAQTVVIGSGGGGGSTSSSAYFNLSNAPVAISGWANLHGSPGSSVISASMNGITLSSVSTSNWVPYNGTTSYNGNGVNAPGFFNNPNVSVNNWYQYGTSAANYSFVKPQLQATGLVPGSSYTVKLSGSDNLGFDTNPVRYCVIGAASYGSVDVNMDYTANNGATFSNVYPDATGKINIYVNTVSGSSAAALVNGIQIIPNSGSGSSSLVSQTSTNITLTGTAIGNNGATITSTSWSQVSGTTTTISTPASLITTVTGLVAGVYSYKLTATDNHGMTATSTVTVTVSTGAAGGDKSIQVNLYGGQNPYSNTAWNNWNVSGATAGAVTSTAFKYSDGTASPVTATLSIAQGVGDNGASFGGTIAPPEVLRYSSYNSYPRTLTLTNVPGSTVKSIEIFGSRNNTGNTSTYTINGVSYSLVTDNNLTRSVVFNNVSVSNGQIQISLTKSGSFNYINGFRVTFSGTTATILASTTEQVLSVETSTFETISDMSNELSVFPNPFESNLNIKWQNEYTGSATISVYSLDGRLITTRSILKSQPVYSDHFELRNVSRGIYLLQIKLPTGKTFIQKIVKG